MPTLHCAALAANGALTSVRPNMAISSFVANDFMYST
jgi:hypothetical protein